MDRDNNLNYPIGNNIIFPTTYSILNFRTTDAFAIINSDTIDSYVIDNLKHFRCFFCKILKGKEKIKISIPKADLSFSDSLDKAK